MPRKMAQEQSIEQSSKEVVRNPAAHLVSYQFKPGQSGNPSGRPKGRKSLWAVFQETLEKEIAEGKTRIELLVEILVAMAESKDLKAIQEVLNRYAGKVPDVIQAEGVASIVDPERQARFLDDQRAIELACELDERLNDEAQ